ncbi:energy transducer TonB [Vibrio sp. S4M6]|uniref:energy transducer TonB n=1 Tax=Vibrio sinus TaxID=2946865 RepID=UPI00202A37E0|nr:energy transducer TonB [Vibrio sinus]MCL9780040.1 energy transducer TonB [Vibrio sinus]
MRLRLLLVLVLLVVGGCSMTPKVPEAKIVQYDQSQNTYTQPIIRIVPVYPEFAIERHVEGYVNLAYDVNQKGDVTNIRVLDAKPEYIFNESSLKALSQWRFSIYPKGKQVVARKNQTVRFDYYFPAKN